MAIRERFPVLRNIRARPSKSYFYSKLRDDIDTHSRCARAADLAAAKFKNAPVFNSEVYYGVDVDAEKLRLGLDSMDGVRTDFLDENPTLPDMRDHESGDGQSFFGVQGDIRDRIFPPNSLDLIVSTHTFGHLPKKDHAVAVDNMLEALRHGGILLLQLDDARWYDRELRRRIQDTFDSVDRVEYSNPLSEGYEELVADDDGQVVFPESRLKSYAMGGMSSLLAMLEAVDPFDGGRVYLRCFHYRDDSTE